MKKMRAQRAPLPGGVGGGAVCPPGRPGSGRKEGYSQALRECVLFCVYICLLFVKL